MKTITLAEIKRKNKQAGQDFFSSKTMKFFGAGKYSVKNGTTPKVVFKPRGRKEIIYDFDKKTGKLKYSYKNLK